MGESTTRARRIRLRSPKANGSDTTTSKTIRWVSRWNGGFISRDVSCGFWSNGNAEQMTLSNPIYGQTGTVADDVGTTQDNRAERDPAGGGK